MNLKVIKRFGDAPIRHKGPEPVSVIERRDRNRPFQQVAYVIKILSLHSRNPELSMDEFVEYWHTTHAPLCSRLLEGLGVLRYTASFPIDDQANLGGFDRDFDVAVELVFDDRAALDAALASPQFNTPERQASSEHVFDLERSRNVTCEEVTFPVWASGAELEMRDRARKL